MRVSDTFVHLRVRSSYSLAEGATHAKKIVALAREHLMPAVAITDVNNLHGALEFSEAASAAGVQPIIGAQVDISLPSFDGGSMITDRLVLICQSDIGFRNLSQILTKAHLDPPESGICSAPVDYLSAHASGLICLWGGGDSALVKHAIRRGGQKIIETLVGFYQRAFDDRLYIEIQRCSSYNHLINDQLIDLACKRGLGVTATNDVYYSHPEMQEAADILLCIGQGRYEGDPNRPQVGPERWLKPPRLMRELFSDTPYAVDNAVHIAQRCAFMVEKRKPILPVFPLPSGISVDEMLRAEARKGFKERIPSIVSRLGEAGFAKIKDRYVQRLEYELNVIIGMSFSGYFLIVSDFMKWAGAKGIPVGCRGSGATSIVAWCLNITHIDPIRFDLVFERFLNPERISLPDFDIDFCQERRGEVIEYVRGKYGKECVAQIISFGSLQARAVIRDVGRVIGLPYSLTDRMSKLVGNAKDLNEALAKEPELSKIAETDTQAARCIQIGRQLEGLYRGTSTHAAGVVISDRSLVEYVPLYKDPNNDIPVTQYHYKDAEKVGLVKFDFLGLRTLTIIAKTVELVRDSQGINIDVLALDFDDEAVFSMLSKADATGVFQLESEGMRSLLRGLHPDKIEHLIALISLYRPGPMDSIPSYIARATGKEEVVYDHPLLEKVLSETYGIITYQEDVMQIARDLGGYSLGQADLLRRAMGKKIKSEMDQHFAQFSDGAKAKGVTDDAIKIIFDKCAKFAGYGFNKGHAAAYAQISFQTAYLKFHYDLEFYAACMTVDIEQIDRLSLYVRELKARGRKVFLPDVNKSQAGFIVEEERGQKGIRYALAAIKGVGTDAVHRITTERQHGGRFKSVENFFERCAGNLITRSQVEKLVKAGAFDQLSSDRGSIIANLESLFGHGQLVHQDKINNQQRLFLASDEMAVVSINVAKRPRVRDLEDEMASIGFYMSGHPLEVFETILKSSGIDSISRVKIKAKTGPRSLHKIAGVIHSIEIRRSKKNGRKFGILKVSDQTDYVEVLAFDDVISASEGRLNIGEVAVFSVTAGQKGDETSFSVETVSTLAENLKHVEKYQIAIDGNHPHFRLRLNDLQASVQKLKLGRTQITVALKIENEGTAIIELPFRYSLTSEFYQTTHDMP